MSQCQMWSRIRAGVLWQPEIKLMLAERALNLSAVKSIRLSLDPFYKDNEALRGFWVSLTKPEVRATNTRLAPTHQLRSDGGEPFFVADLEDKRRIVFKTAGMKTLDVVMRFNRLLGNPEMVRSAEFPDPEPPPPSPPFSLEEL